MKKLIVFIIAIFLISCDTNKTKKDWTYLVYMAADNGLNISAKKDINEMELSNFDREKMNVVVEIDWDDTYHDPGVDRYLIQNDSSSDINSTLVQKLAEHNSGSPSKLADFINWGIKEFPAEHYVLIIWSHANGWYVKNRDFTGNGLCPDISDEGEISVYQGEFKQALADVDHKLDLLVMDACHMQSVEVNYEISSFFDYIVASENDVPTDGFPYQRTLDEVSEMTDVKEIALRFSYRFDDHYFYQIGTPRSTTISVLETDGFRSTIDAWNDFWQNNQKILTTTLVDEIQENLHYYQNPERDVDIDELLKLISYNIESEDIKDQISELRYKFKETYIDIREINLSGLGMTSIWFPKSRPNFELLKDEYSELDFAETIWFSILNDYYESDKNLE